MFCKIQPLHKSLDWPGLTVVLDSINYMYTWPLCLEDFRCITENRKLLCRLLLQYQRFVDSSLDSQCSAHAGIQMMFHLILFQACTLDNNPVFQRLQSFTDHRKNMKSQGYIHFRNSIHFCFGMHFHKHIPQHWHMAEEVWWHIHH